MQETQAIIRRIMERHAAVATPEDFHRAVNVTFHQFESEVYDDEHRDMWESLPRQFELLVEDCLRLYPETPREIHLLDIGCGTGLASDSILKTKIGARIKSVDLLDTSPAMLRRAKQRASGWNIPSSTYEGLIESLSGDKRYELIVTCSVLHHVPDLPAFLCAVHKVQAEGGIFLHLQDPNGDYLKHPELQRRMAEHSRSRVPEWAARLAPRRVMGRLYRELTGKQGQDYVAKTNRALLENGVIVTPLSIAELYAITDIHTDYGDGEGVSIERMKLWMPDYECLSQRSYGFFGGLWSTLPQRRKQTEEDLIARQAPEGLHVGAIWKLKPLQRA